MIASRRLLVFASLACTSTPPVQATNCDGVDDIVVYGGNNLNPRIYMRVSKGVGHGTFQATIETTLPYGCGNPGKMTVGNADGVGATDVLATYWFPSTGSTLPVLHSTGLGSFTIDSPPSPGMALTNGGVAVGDLDGDGIDEVAAASLSGAVRLHRRGAAGLERVLPDVPMSVSDLRIADLNGDGRKDLIGTDENPVVAINNGSLAFTPPLSYTGARTLQVRDFNGDGKVDVASSTGGAIFVWLAL